MLIKIEISAPEVESALRASGETDEQLLLALKRGFKGEKEVMYRNLVYKLQHAAEKFITESVQDYCIKGKL